MAVSQIEPEMAEEPPSESPAAPEAAQPSRRADDRRADDRRAEDRRSGDRRTDSRAPDVTEKLRARRHQIQSLRKHLVLVDLASTVVGLGVGVLTGHAVVAVMAFAVSVAVAGQVGSADSARDIVSIRRVLRSALLLSGAACVLMALLGWRDMGRELLLGAACASVVHVAVRCAVRLTGLRGRYGIGQRRRLLVGDPSALGERAARAAQAGGPSDEIVVITRAERRTDPAAPAGDRRSVATGPDQRQRRDERGGPAGVVERVVRTALDAGAERVTVIPGDSWGQAQLRELSWLLEGTGVDMVIATTLDGIAPHRVDVTEQDGRLMIKVGSASPRGTRALLKGLFDRFAALLLIVVSAPVLLVIAAAIRLGSDGPAVFRQTRVREGGETFTMYKFRTMRVNAEQQLGGLQQLSMHSDDGPLFKMENDPRITRVGHLLRKTSLDELPQLLNVVKGQMSLIGPRPALPMEVATYDYAARRRLAVKPGMTGLWQVSGRSRLTWDESLRYDLDYVDNWSPFTDAAIAVRTFRAVVTKDGAF